MPVLDGIRGLAVLMVLVFHFIGTTLVTNSIEGVIVGVTKYGSYGVELFFVLSGFLITGILYDTRAKSGYFRNFYMRRALRIFPLYYGVLLLAFVVAPLIPALRGPTLDSLVDRQAWAWLYAVNIYIAWKGEWSFSYIQHFWSLAVEEHFYLFWPLVVFFLVHRPRALMAVCLGTAAAALLGRLIASLIGLSWWTTYVFTPFRLDGLALGAFIAVAARQPGGMDRLARALPRVTAAASLLFVGTFPWKRLMPGQDVQFIMVLSAGLIQVLLGCLVLWVLTAPSWTLVSRCFRSRGLMFIGTYSYGLYVYHHFLSYYFTTHRTELVIAGWIGSHTLAVMLQALVGMAASLAIAYLSYEYFEKRFLQMKRYFEAPRAPEAASQPPQLRSDVPVR